ncbi:MAG: cupin domain-containing protein [Pseudomonadota bacterium]
MSTTEWKFAHSEACRAEWTPGMRTIFDYRDLGILQATGGDFVAHVIRANGRENEDDVQQWHVHECRFQMIFVLNGWAKFEYDGEGIHTLSKGDCVLQPPGIRHREVDCSVDFEVLEIVSPADFKTTVIHPETD